MVTEAFKIATLKYRARGGKLYKLAHDHDISPTMLSATITGARRVVFDPRIVQIGIALGLQPDEVFEPEPEDETRWPMAQ